MDWFSNEILVGLWFGGVFWFLFKIVSLLNDVRDSLDHLTQATEREVLENYKRHHGDI